MTLNPDRRWLCRVALRGKLQRAAAGHAAAHWHGNCVAGMVCIANSRS